ncbi:MAG: DUF1622 domain-containing protein [Pseudomonadota bacterium]|nr:DUF1622 domain-containing protein [Pseudomonadota bacterium]
MASFKELVEIIGIGVDGVGVLLIVVGAIFATWRFLLGGKAVPPISYRVYRQELGKAILLGLEFLVAGDIIRTVAVAPTLENVIVLGIIVLIRTFLSMSLEVELEGRWPWQRRDEPQALEGP